MKKVFTIKEYREFLGISQFEISNKLGISQAAYSKIESTINFTKNERYKVIAKILDLDVTHIKNNKVELLFVVCKEYSDCTEMEKVSTIKVLKTIEVNINYLNKIYKNY